MPGQEEKGKGMVDAAVAADGYDSADVLAVSAECNGEEWILDSGCSFHMTPNQHWFESYRSID